MQLSLYLFFLSFLSLAFARRFPKRIRNKSASVSLPTQTSTALSAIATSSPTNISTNVASKAQVNSTVQANAADSSGLPNGVSVFAAQPPDTFCAQFKSIPAAIGTQLTAGGVSCSSTQLGLTPAANNIISTMITNPQAGATVDATVDNTVSLDIINETTGFFNLAASQYYLAPQTLDPANGAVQGHQHIVVQKLAGNTPPNPKTFAFFKGVNTAASDPQKRSLSATIPAGTLKENGQYRICTITGADAHQPHIQGTFRRGPQDDCIRISVGNAVGAANQPIAADTAQNPNVTVNGRNTTTSANLTDGAAI